MDVIVNENRLALPPEVATWGEVLDWVEMEQLNPGQCITRVRFEGREEINYRKSVVCGQSIEEVGSIEIESGDFDAVLRESLGELDTEVKNAIESTRTIIRSFENREDQKGYTELSQLLDSVRLFYAVFSEDLGWSDVSDLGIARDQFTPALENAIKQLIAAQENHFWVSICDVLEYELVPILEAWQKTVERTRVRVN